MKLDEIDLKILRLLQNDAKLTNKALSDVTFKITYVQGIIFKIIHFV